MKETSCQAQAYLFLSNEQTPWPVIIISIVSLHIHADLFSLSRQTNPNLKFNISAAIADYFNKLLSRNINMEIIFIFLPYYESRLGKGK